MPEETSFRPPESSGVSRLVRLTSVDEGNALFAQWRGRFDQISSGPFRSTLRIIRAGALRLTEIEVNQRVRSRGHDVAGLFSAHLVTEANAGSVWQGRRLEPGRLVTNGVEAVVDHLTARHARHIGLFVSPEVLNEAARTLLRRDDASVPRTWTSCAPSPRALAGLNRAIARLLHIGAGMPGLLSTTEARQFEQETILWLAESLFAGGTPVRTSLNP